MLAILVPSRGRPQNLRRLVDAVAATATGPYSIYTYLDDDDQTADAYRGLDVKPTLGPRIFFAPALNVLAKIAVDEGATHFAILGDDVVPETVGWDEKLIAALDSRVGVAYGSDGLEQLHGADLPTHVVLPVDLYRRLGWVALPSMRHLYIDNVWRCLGQGVGNFVYRPDVKLTHLHRWNKAAPDDQTYREANDKRKRDEDRRAFEVWRDGEGLPSALKALA